MNNHILSARNALSSAKIYGAKHGLTVSEGGLNIWLALPSQFNVNQLSGYLSSQNIKLRTADFLFNHPKAKPTVGNAVRMALGSFTHGEEFNQGLKAFEQALLEFMSQQQEPII